MANVAAQVDRCRSSGDNFGAVSRRPQHRVHVRATTDHTIVQPASAVQPGRGSRRRPVARRVADQAVPEALLGQLCAAGGQDHPAAAGAGGAQARARRLPHQSPHRRRALGSRGTKGRQHPCHPALGAPTPGPQRCKGLPVSTPEQTFLELAAAGLSLVDLVIVADGMIRAEHTAPGRLADAAAGWHGRGCRVARRAADLAREGVDSPMESRLRLLLVLAGLPEPRVNSFSALATVAGSGVTISGTSICTSSSSTTDASTPTTSSSGSAMSPAARSSIAVAGGSSGAGSERAGRYSVPKPTRRAFSSPRSM